MISTTFTKKIAAVTAAVALTLTLGACGNKEDEAQEEYPDSSSYEDIEPEPFPEVLPADHPWYDLREEFTPTAVALDYLGEEEARQGIDTAIAALYDFNTSRPVSYLQGAFNDFYSTNDPNDTFEYNTGYQALNKWLLPKEAGGRSSYGTTNSPRQGSENLYPTQTLHYEAKGGGDGGTFVGMYPAPSNLNPLWKTTDVQIAPSAEAAKPAVELLFPSEEDAPELTLEFTYPITFIGHDYGSEQIEEHYYIHTAEVALILIEDGLWKVSHIIHRPDWTPVSK